VDHVSRLPGKIALITGAGSGFGEGMARRFAAEGARVAALDVRMDQACRVAGAIGDGAIAIEADVSSGDAVAQAVDRTIDALGVPDIVVNNAGVTHRNRPILEVDEATFDRIFAVNVKSIFNMVRAVVPRMRDNGGGVMLNVGSTAGIRPRPGLTWYNASKGAVNLVSKSLAVELAPWRIRVNVLCPVMGVTGMLTEFMGVEDTPENRARFLATIPLGRLSQPEDIAAAALFLASDEAAFITGVELPVDGGRTI
jgi:3-oxoacyl-[acyl-carrier protein] reductase